MHSTQASVCPPQPRSPSVMSNRSMSIPRGEPEIHVIQLHKSNNGMGLSIVATKVSTRPTFLVLCPSAGCSLFLRRLCLAAPTQRTLVILWCLFGAIVTLWHLAKYSSYSLLSALGTLLCGDFFRYWHQYYSMGCGSCLEGLKIFTVMKSYVTFGNTSYAMEAQEGYKFGT